MTKDADSLDRRPIAARKLRFSTWMTNVLVKARISPNTISVTSVFFGTASGLCFAATGCQDGHRSLLFVAAGLSILLRLLANMFDGMVAVQTGTSSPVGELYNEIPDRISDSFILVGAGYGFSGSITAGYIAALAAMLTAYIRAVGKGAGAKQEFCGPMAKQQRMFLLIVMGLFLAFAPEHLAAATFASQGVMGLLLWVIAVLAAFTSLRRGLRIGQALRRQSQGG